MANSGYVGEHSCEKCVKQKTCKKTIGIMYGFCDSDFVPKGKAVKWKMEQHEKDGGVTAFVLSFENC